MMPHRWPLHPPPYPHESLSSWLERLAGAYGYRSDDLLTYDLGFTALSPEELDKDPPHLLLERLAERSGVSVKRLGAMTIHGWIPLLIDSLTPDPSRYATYVERYAILYPIALRRSREFRDWVPWISAHRFNGSAACLLCLKEGSEPYRRLSWRMAWMTSCPRHGILLEDIFVLAGRSIGEAAEEPVPAPPEILTIDRLTSQAIEDGVVPLPGMQVPGGIWLKLLRALLDELSLPAASVKQYRTTLSRIWGSLGIRQGMRSAEIPFEMMDPERQFLLMRVAGVAIEMLMKGVFKNVGDDARLFRPLSRSHEDRPAPSQAKQPDGKRAGEDGELSAYEQAWKKVGESLKELDIAMRHHLDTAMEMRNFLLGTNPTPEKVEKIDHLFREQGYRLPDDVI